MNKKKALNLLYILFTLGIVALIGFNDRHIQDIWAVFRKLDMTWMMTAFSCMALYWIADALILNYTTASMYEKKDYIQSLKVALIGQYYNAVTPFASGGQPVQAYYMMKDGVPIGYASSILTVKFLAYQIVLSIYCAVAAVWKGKMVYFNYPRILWISLIGFIINAGAILLIFMVMINKVLVIRFAKGLISLGCRFKVIKDAEKVTTNVKKHLEDFHKSAEFMKTNFKAVLTICIITFFQLTFYFSITYFIYRAFGLKEAGIIDIIFVQSFLYLAVSFFPTPGASGASEGGFYIFFDMFFHKEFLFVSMLIWRLISYYANIAVGGVVILGDSIHNFRKAEKV